MGAAGSKNIAGHHAELPTKELYLFIFTDSKSMSVYLKKKKSFVSKTFPDGQLKKS